MVFKTRNRACFLILLFNTAFISSSDYKPSQGCPPQCNCSIIHVKDDFSSPEEWSKVKCNKRMNENLSIDDLKLNNVLPQIYQLELNLNLTNLENSFLKLNFLQKLDLSRNEVKYIDNEAFKYLKNLKRLDLSHNKIVNLNKNMFEPLHSLERLKLNNNSVVHIYKGVFDHLKSLKSLDISENPLDCDCTLIWIKEWSKSSSVKLVEPPKCESPPSSKGKPLRKLKLQCDGANLYSISSGLELKPTHNQIVFEGDSFSLTCRSLLVGTYGDENSGAQVIWSWKNKDPASYFDEIKIENRMFAENGFLESQLKIDKIHRNHSGEWYCHLLSESGNHSTAISVIVLSENSQYCPQIDTKNNKGIYHWPKTFVGFTVDLPCATKQPVIVGNKAEPRALHTCKETGIWENLNTSHCPYVSETTRILEQFSQVNLSIAKGSVLDSAIKLKNFTGNGKHLTDAMDIVFISKTVENYLMFIKNNKELAYVLVDIVATVMDLSKTLLIEAQAEQLACSRLVRSVEVICKDVPSVQFNKSNLAVKGYVVAGIFSGIRCIWYLNGYKDKHPRRFFHCSTNNRTGFLGGSDKIIEASVQIPSSLFTQLEMQGKSTHNVLHFELILSMYENSNFFPGMPNSHEEVSSCVVGSTLVGMEVSNLTEPVYIMLRAPFPFYTSEAKPVWWDQYLNNGSGGWREEGCMFSSYAHGMVVFHCNRFGYFGLLQNIKHLSDYSGRYSRGKLHLCHPAVYTGSFILIVCLVISTITYLMSHTFIQMSRRAKHSIVNTWVSISLLCFFFSCGIYHTENVKICQGIGIVLHYLFLSTLLWMSVSASNMYKRLSKSNPLDGTAEDDLPPVVRIQKPILGLYLVGWGIGLIVCGISGAVNLKEYASRNFCFLESGPALSAVYVPAGMLLAFLMLFYVLTLCAIRNNDTNGQLSEGTQGTENVDLELLEVPAAITCIDRRSVASIETADSDDIEDPEHSPIIQLKAHIIVLILYCSIWSLAALSLTDSFHDTFQYYQETCSILYCILAFCLGAFILYFYCVARSDVRSQWTLLKKVFHGKKIHCCRSRTISDTHRNFQRTPSLGLPNGSSVHQTVSALSTSSVNSSGHTGKTNSHNSNRVKAVKKLNSCDSREEPLLINGAVANNVNLVAIHRQMYRSNNSVPTYHEISGPDCVEAFYNPRQSIVARKFFRKQRRNKRNHLGLRRRGDGGGTSEGEIPQARRTWRPSAESAVFFSSDMENTNEKVDSTCFGYAPKINNSHLHSGGNGKHRKIHSPKNRNFLTDSDEENRNKLPLDRLVIGAEGENEISLKNNDRISPYDFGLSRVDELSVSEEMGATAAGETSTKNFSQNQDNEDSDVRKTSPDFRTVELQCSLGENSFSDLNSETNYCDCSVNERINGSSSFPLITQDCRLDTERNEETLSSAESGPDCDSFNEKIDGLRLHSDSSFSESPHNKTDSYCSHIANSQVVKAVEPQSEVSISKKKGANQISISTPVKEDLEKDLLTDQNEAKKETSV